jgi:hypothetical protein
MKGRAAQGVAQEAVQDLPLGCGGRPDTVEIYKKCKADEVTKQHRASPPFQQSCVSLSSLSLLHFLQQRTQPCTPDNASTPAFLVNMMGIAVLL